jgi:transcriptional repressor NrdR
MQCPYCKQADSRVTDSRLAAGGTTTWRRRECETCKKRFTTYERVEYTLPTVIKKDGEREAFDRDKIIRGLRIACIKRPVTEEQIESVAATLEQELAATGEREIAAVRIGQLVMARLQELDEVAYVRFASVYKSFRDADEFRQEMGELVRSRRPS